MFVFLSDFSSCYSDIQFAALTTFPVGVYLTPVYLYINTHMTRLADLTRLTVCECYCETRQVNL